MADNHGDAQRPGELRVDLPPAEDAGLRFIGVLRTPFTDRSLCPHQGDMEEGPECFVVLHAPYVPALEGIESQDHLQLLYWLHEARRDLLTQQRRGEGAPRGTFTLRSPLRPNPLGVSSVRLLRREGARLVVRGLDCLDGTPLLDIKPIRCGKEPR